MFSIINNGPLIGETDYWSSGQADYGLVYASWNAGALRLLLPTDFMLVEMRSGKTCELRYVTLRDLPALEVLFDDASDSPFSITMDSRQSDRLIPRLDQTTCRVLAYTPVGLEAEWPGVWHPALR